MKKGIYVIYDIVAKQIASNTIMCDSDDVLLRELKDAKLPDTMEKHPNDFDVFKLGVIDTVCCSLEVDKSLVAHLGVLKNGKNE